MKITTLPLRPRTVCQLCDYILSQPAGQRRLLGTSALAATQPALIVSSRPQVQDRLPCRTVRASEKKAKTVLIRTIRTQSGTEAAAEVATAQELGNKVLKSRSIPTEEETLKALQACEAAAQRLMGRRDAPVAKPDGDTTPASALLHLDSRPAPATSSTIPIDLLSNLAYKLIAHPTVFITPRILESYVRTQCLLQRPDTFPEVFDLYASKPVPQPNTNPVRFKAPNPNKASAAVPSAVANMALDAAIQARSLPLALSIINTTFRTPAFSRAKLIKQALPPLLGFSLTPLAAYTVASQLSAHQNTMDPSLATKLAFAGILAYVGATATIGVVAVTTANDQMDRVTWATGMPLRERWLREEERAAVDRVAGAWGFSEAWKRGEEEGVEWEALREWCGVNGMVLDRVELMEGME